MVRSFIIIFILLLPGEEYRGKVVKVVDGDTIDILDNKTTSRIRLYGIDAPERGQAFNVKAREYVADLVAGKKVRVVKRYNDKYRRIVGDVYLPDGTYVNAAIVKAGYAWHFKKYSKDPELAELEVEARKAKRGLWQNKAPQPPWEFRKNRGKVKR